MLWYPKKPEGGIRKATRKHTREDEQNAPTNPGEASYYWSNLSELYSRTSSYYSDVAMWWLCFAGVFLVISLLAQVVNLVSLMS